MRIVALHGKGMTGASFRHRLTPLLDRLEADGVVVDLVAVDAPWAEGDGFAWWQLPPGVRSYEADSFDGVERTLELLDAQFDRGEVDAVVGFSQGAILMSFYLAQQLALRLAGDATARLPRKALLIGAAWPRPFGHALEALAAMRPDAVGASGCALLHVVGERDDINPPAQAVAIHECFGEAASALHMHAGRHVVPMDERSMQAMRDFLLGAGDDVGGDVGRGGDAAACSGSAQAGPTE